MEHNEQKITPILGSLEQEVMQYMWQYKQASVRDVYTEIRKKRSIAYTTVMTVMFRLYKKGLLKRRKKNNAHVYTAVTDRETFYKQTSEDFVKGYMQQFGEVAIASFIDALDEMDPEKLNTLQQELDKHLHDEA